MKELVLEQLRHLAGSLHSLQGRVRNAVAGEVAKSVAETVAEVVDGVMSGRFVGHASHFGRRDSNPGSTRYGRSEWDEPDGESWQGPRSVDSPGDGEDDQPAPSESNVPAVLAMALTAGRWWLIRGRSPWSAAGVGLAVGGALLAGGPAANAVLGIVWAVHRLMAISDALGEGSKSLDRV